MRRHLPFSCTDMDNAISCHYNSIAQLDRPHAQEDVLYNLRMFHNWIKMCLIATYLPLGGTVCDIGCGRGGDLLKVKARRPTQYVGFDIARFALQEATRRAISCGASHYCNFILKNVFTEPIPASVESGSFDTAMLHFTIQYACDSTQNLVTCLSNVRCVLKDGGHATIIMPHYDVLLGLYNDHGKTVKRELFSIEFVDEPRDHAVYSFTLENAVRCQEWMITPSTLQRYAELFGLDVIYSAGMEEIKEHFMKQGMCASQMFVRLEEKDKQVTGLYRIVVLKKKCQT